MRAKLIPMMGVVIAAATLLFGTAGTAASHPAGEGDRASVGRGGRAYGVVEGIDDGKLTLATPVGVVTAIADANTVFRGPALDLAGLGDFAVGDTVALAGWWGEASTFHAFVVVEVMNDHLFPLTGTLVDVAEQTLTVETSRGPATVLMGDTVRYHIPGIAESGPGDLPLGSKIVVRGTLNEDGVLVAQVVTVLPRARPWLLGRLTSVEGETLQVRTLRRGQVGVLTDALTRLLVPGVENETLADLKTGDIMAAGGKHLEEGVMEAAFVAVLPEKVARLTGQVSAVEGTTVTVETTGGAVRILTDASTVVRGAGLAEAGLDGIEMGVRINAIGVWADEATFRAIVFAVNSGCQAGTEALVRGRAIRVEGSSLVLGAPQGPVTVQVDDQTQYRVPGATDPGLVDVEAGALVSAQGTWSEDGTLHAQSLRVQSRAGIARGLRNWLARRGPRLP